MTRAKYYCSQSALYLVSANVLQSLANHLPDFEAFRGKYNPVFFTRAYDVLIQAKNLPDNQALSTRSETHFADLNTAFAECANIWQSLKRYIKAAYPPAEQKQRFEQAGLLYYKKANLKSWDAARHLLISAQNFLNNQKTVLTANDNMPDTFQTRFINAHTNFSHHLFLFQQSEEKGKVHTLNKLNANNVLFALITEICLDGQCIFKRKPLLKAEFTFTSVHALVGGKVPKRSSPVEIALNSSKGNGSPLSLTAPLPSH